MRGLEQGDIGTSLLYTFSAVFAFDINMADATHEEVITNIQGASE